jgi:adenylate kinase
VYNIIFVGAPGSGKGTQAAAVAQKLNLVHISSGDLFREAVAKGTELGKKANSYLEKGELVPDEITIQMVLEKLSAPEVKKGVLLDGFPRNLEQAEALDKALTKQGNGIDGVVHIMVSEDELTSRLSGRRVCRRCGAVYHVQDSPPRAEGKCDKCGGELYQRPDDNPQTIKNRLKVYSRETEPIIDYYRRRGRLLEVNGEGNIAEVTQRIVAALQEEKSIAR